MTDTSAAAPVASYMAFLQLQLTAAILLAIVAVFFEKLAALDQPSKWGRKEGVWEGERQAGFRSPLSGVPFGTPPEFLFTAILVRSRLQKLAGEALGIVSKKVRSLCRPWTSAE